MTTFGRPGVYVQENLVQQSIVVDNRSDAIGAFIGSLPKGPTAPTLISSWSEFTKAFGGLNYSYPVSSAVYLFFSNGGRDTYIRRVNGSGAAVAHKAILDDADATTFTVNAVNAGTWGNDISVEILETDGDRFSIVVYGAPLTIGGDLRSNVLEQFNDLSMNTTDSRYVVPTVNSFSAYISIADEETGNTPAYGSGLQALSTGANGAAPARADISAIFTDFDDIETPLLFNIPDAANWETEANSYGVAADLLEYAEARGDAFVIIDTPAGKTAAEAVSYAASVKSTNVGSNGAVYYPWLTIPDTSRSTPGVTRGHAPGGAIVGQYQATDTARGVFKTPAGYNTRLSIAVGLESKLTNDSLDTLNSANTPVNAIRVTPGAGIVVMGGRTLSNTSPNRYINMRRSLIYLKKELTDRSQFAVFENNDEGLWNQITSSLSNFLNIYWQQGGLRGTSPDQAFYVKCDSTTTSQSDIVNGRVNIQIGVALEYPAEFIVITIGQITGSASVTQG